MVLNLQSDVFKVRIRDSFDAYQQSSPGLDFTVSSTVTFVICQLPTGALRVSFGFLWMKADGRKQLEGRA